MRVAAGALGAWERKHAGLPDWVATASWRASDSFYAASANS